LAAAGALASKIPEDSEWKQTARAAYAKRQRDLKGAKK
jgi:hypothetical protein